MSDTVLARSSSAKYQSHPEGQFVAQCVDVIDLGDKVEQYQDQPKKIVPKAALVFRTGERNGEGEYIDVAKEFTVSMGERATLRKFLEDWRGKPYTAEQVTQGVPLHKLTGQYGLVNVSHKVSGQGRTYANIKTCVPVPKQMSGSLFAYNDYTRADYWTTRKQEYAAGVQAFKASNAAPPSDEEFPDALRDEPTDDLPF